MRKYNILLVDDDLSILKALKRALLEAEQIIDLHIVTATNAMEALEILKSTRFHLVVSDEMMPGMSGVNFLNQVKNKYPDTMRIMLTGQASLEVAVKAINQGEIYRFLTKPWDNFELVITVRHALNHYDLEAKNRYLLKKVNQQVDMLRHLEKQIPGITNVKTDDEGSMIVSSDLDQINDEDLDALIAEWEEAGVEI